MPLDAVTLHTGAFPTHMHPVVTLAESEKGLLLKPLTERDEIGTSSERQVRNPSALPSFIV